jgi:hypothetical protein
MINIFCQKFGYDVIAPYAANVDCAFAGLIRKNAELNVNGTQTIAQK